MLSRRLCKKVERVVRTSSVEVRDRRVEKVASLRREPPIISPWLGLALDGSVMVSNVAGSSEIYALDWEAP